MKFPSHPRSIPGYADGRLALFGVIALAVAVRVIGLWSAHDIFVD